MIDRKQPAGQQNSRATSTIASLRFEMKNGAAAATFPPSHARRLTRSTISRITIPRPVDPLSARFSSRTDRGHAAGFSVHTCDRRRRSRPTGPARRVSSNFGHRGTKCVWSPPTFATGCCFFAGLRGKLTPRPPW